MRRRALLLAAAALPTVPGCSDLGVGSPKSPENDCSRASRPEPAAPDSSDAVEPATYPDPLESPGADAELVAFVEGFEETYRRNSLVQQRGESMISFGFFTSETWTEDAPEGAGVAGVEYAFSYSEEIDGDVAVVDSGYHTAVYYVDGSIALRAHRERSRTNGDEPDPREDGDAVACYE